MVKGASPVPAPNSSNPVFDDGMMITNGEIIFGIVEKKTR
jgi:hypothetical protein